MNLYRERNKAPNKLTIKSLDPNHVGSNPLQNPATQNRIRLTQTQIPQVTIHSFSIPNSFLSFPVAMAKEEKLSFSFSSSSKRKHSKPSFDQTADDPPSSKANNPQFVTEFDSSKTLDSSAPRRLVIAPIPNSTDFRTNAIKKMKSLLPDPAAPDAEADDSSKFVAAPADDPSSQTGVTYGLTIRSNPSLNSDPKPKSEELIQKQFQEDIRNLPDAPNLEEFQAVPIESFGAAILAGYGWSEGQGLGRNKKEDTKVVQYDRRAGTQGLGYDPSANDGIVKVKSGRESVYKVDKRRTEDKKKTRVVRIVSGVHIGKKGEVLRRVGGLETLVRLENGGGEVRVEEDRIAELGSKAEERCLRKLKELEIDERKERSEKNVKRREKGGGMKGNGSDRSSQVKWLKSHIRVRIISKDFQRGKWYSKKGEVVDVVGPTTCDIVMDGSKELVQGVEQEMLETALPKYGGSVLVLYGRHQGVYGSLVERDREEGTGVVRDADNPNKLVTVRLEQIAEYVGDPSYLGYDS